MSLAILIFNPNVFNLLSIAIFYRLDNFKTIKYTKHMINIFNKNKINLSAFTLAEVLITLGIIGVVAVLTIPTLISKYYEHQTITKMLETQSILIQAIRQSEEEYGEMLNWGLIGSNANKANVLGEKLKPFLKIAIDCGPFDYDGNCFPKEPYKYLNGRSLGFSYATGTSYKYKFVLMNGVSVAIQPIVSTSCFQINIDTNGIAKPNMFGKDLFLFSYDEDSSSLVAMGAPNSLYPMKEYCVDKNSNGAGCAYYLLQYRNMNYLKR